MTKGLSIKVVIVATTATFYLALFGLPRVDAQESYFDELIGEWYDYDTGTSFEIKRDGRVVSEDAAGLQGRLRQSTDSTDFSIINETGLCAYKVKVVVPRKELGWSLRSGPNFCPKLRHVSRMERSAGYEQDSSRGENRNSDPAIEKSEPARVSRKAVNYDPAMQREAQLDLQNRLSLCVKDQFVRRAVNRGKAFPLFQHRSIFSKKYSYVGTEETIHVGQCIAQWCMVKDGDNCGWALKSEDY